VSAADHGSNGLLRDSGRVFLEAAPEGLDADEAGKTLASHPHVAGPHDLSTSGRYRVERAFLKYGAAPCAAAAVTELEGHATLRPGDADRLTLEWPRLPS